MLIRRLGIDPTSAPLAGYDRVYAYDPFGNRIELMQELGER
ncbi:MAG TPA: hypothetical protein VM030_09680 [Acidimicrobiales bacterium]|nr:hypothetical protein [Acidimicrobiales bacterium]